MTQLFKNKYRIDSTRLKGWDYSWDGWYFITICTYRKYCHFGNIENEKMTLNNVGKLVKKYWLEIPKHFENTKLDYFVIMPNHIHGIIIIDKNMNNTSIDNNISYNKQNPSLVEALHRNGSNNVFVEALHCNGSSIINHPNNDSNYNSTNKSSRHNKSLQCNDSTGRHFYSKISPKPKSVPTIIRSFKSICTKIINKNQTNAHFTWQSSFYDHIIKNKKELENIRKYIHTNPLKWNIDKNNPINIPKIPLQNPPKSIQ